VGAEELGWHVGGTDVCVRRRERDNERARHEGMRD